MDLVLENVTNSIPALMALGVFFLAYALVVVEEFIKLRKSKPVLLAAGVIWLMVAFIAEEKGLTSVTNAAVRHNLMDYAQILLFVIVAMTYINALNERHVFEALRSWLVARGFSYRQLFWLTGTLAFFISGIADNLTTALAMSAVVLAVGKDSPRFVGLACINLVVASNAGGAFSPFGDITTLMVWQAGLLPFEKFFHLFLPSVVNFIIPALCLHCALPKGRPKRLTETIQILRGGKRIILLFLLTIATTVGFQNYFNLPPALGMMVGLSYLQFFAYYTKYRGNIKTFEIFPAMQALDWDTLLFFYGVMLSIGGLSTLGYLKLTSSALYTHLGASLTPAFQHTPGNILIGILSAIVDNIPLMFAVITMHPPMSEGQWLLVTLTAGVGGSLLSVGSAAGVAVMGQARGFYTFFTHLKWIWAIALGYAASIAFHLWWNARLF